MNFFHLQLFLVIVVVEIIVIVEVFVKIVVIVGLGIFYKAEEVESSFFRFLGLMQRR